MIRFAGEKKQSGKNHGNIRKSFTAIDDLGLKDLPLGGDNFTWKGRLENQIISRLDRFLVSAGMDNYFGASQQFLLPKPLWDHFPILLAGGGTEERGPQPFRFENTVLRICDLKSQVSKI